MSTDKNQNLFINKELSWMEFNSRVLAEAANPKTPLFEKLRFLSITTNNFNEFFMVRVAGLKKLKKEGFYYCESPDKQGIAAILDQIHEKTKSLIKQQYAIYHSTIQPQLPQKKIVLHKFKDLNDYQKRKLTRYFKDKIFPILTPLSSGPAHSKPFLINQSIYIIADLDSKRKPTNQNKYLGFIEVPSSLPRLISINTKDKKRKHFIFLEDLIGSHLKLLFLGMKIRQHYLVRVTRNLDYHLLESKVIDLLESVQKKVKTREQQEAVRIEVSSDFPQNLQEILLSLLALNNQDVYKIPKPFYLPSMMELYKYATSKDLEPKFDPKLPIIFGKKESDIFSFIKEKDFLVHHPYESFHTVSELIKYSATDDNVLAIKITLYRFTEDSDIMNSLLNAAKRGKNVTVVLELKARFDEQKNIDFAKKIERAGANVIYGFVDFKIHCKACLIVRQEKQAIVRYAHLSTGNYNSFTATHYTDIGLFTARADLTEDISSLFNLLTGGQIVLPSILDKTKNSVPKFKHLIVAPFFMRSFIEEKINGLIAKAKNKNCLLIAKLNHLEDKKTIKLLYKASQHGVKIKLIIRGICALRPQVKGLSENIEVVSIIDRYLEHSRMYFFSDGNTNQTYLGSADWMGRNLDKRVEIIFPILDKNLITRVQEILSAYLKDNMKARVLQTDGTYKISPDHGEPSLFRVQNHFMELTKKHKLS